MFAPSTTATGPMGIFARAEIRLRQERRKFSATSSATSCLACRGVTNARGEREPMQFGLSESQQLLKDNARKFFAGECPMEKVRRLMETGTAYDETLWKKMAEQGYTGIIFPEEYGGVG